jgi:HSP20 family protein
MADIDVRDRFDTDGGFAPVRAMRRMFEELAPSWTPSSFDEPFPVDISEVDGSLKVEASLPGFNKDEINVELSGGVLTIKARHEEEQEAREENYYRRERRMGAMSRRVELPGRVPDDADADAELRDGVLRITVPVEEERTGGQRIAVRTS